MNLGFLVRRLGQAIVTVIVASIVIFALLRFSPGDPATLMLGESATPEQVAAFRTDMGLDLPIPIQYLRYVSALMQGDMGTSIRAQQPALDYVLQRVPGTALLASLSILVAILIGFPLGVLSAAAPNSIGDILGRGVSFITQAVPGFWLGLMLITVFSVTLKLLPPSGYGSAAHLIMPTITLSSYVAGFVVRLVRAEMMSVLSEDYIRTAQAKGLSQFQVLFKHALRNAAIPVVTMLGLQLGILLSGSVVTETVFAWPGVGLLAMEAIGNRDYPVLQVIVILSVLTFVTINFLIDVLYSIIDPRIRVA